ncbi:porin [Azohydromonas australica]|uniref:porin n=1 Tax=Azohydromonas australica TaxID=364039 RepID=UPI000402797F|nr:porin [Azohydromonas australica]
MKPSLVAATVLSTITCAAAAQSSVSIYGIADAWVGQTRHKAGGPSVGSIGVVESGGAQASRWGLRGSEDLGGGLRANFVLEQGISIDSGTVTNVSASAVGFNRTAFVSLYGPFGELRLGRMLTAFDAMRGSTNQLFDSSGFASTGQVWSAGATAANGLAEVAGSDYLARGNNTVLYATPQTGPVSASVSFSLGEGATTAKAAPRMATGHIKYVAGKTRIGYAYQNEKYATGDNNFHLVSGIYDFGRGRVVAAFQRQTDERIAGHQKSNEWQVGVDVPLGAATLSGGLARAVTKDGGGIEVADARGMSFLASYSLSKRTRVYTAFRKLKVTRADGSASLDTTRYGIGLNHNF